MKLRLCIPLLFPTLATIGVISSFLAAWVAKAEPSGAQIAQPLTWVSVVLIFGAACGSIVIALVGAPPWFRHSPRPLLRRGRKII